jgi:hypothetical protein
MNLENNKWLKPLIEKTFTIAHGLNRGLKKRNFLYNRFNDLHILKK